MEALDRWLLNHRFGKIWVHSGTCISEPRTADDLRLCRADFDPSGKLLQLSSIALGADVPPETAAQVARAIIDAYNDCIMLPEPHRARAIADRVRLHSENGAAASHLNRLLRSPWISFEAMPPAGSPRRFVVPHFAQRRNGGAGLLNLVCRLSDDQKYFDVWLQVHHAVADGLPIQEMLSDLERACGAAPSVYYPTPQEFAPLVRVERCSSTASPRAIDHVQDVIDFTPLLVARNELNARYKSALGGTITIAAMVVWGLAAQPEFAGRVFASTVEVPATHAEEASVNFVVLRPADFLHRQRPLAGFLDFARAFNDQIIATRERRSPNYRATAAAAALPARMGAWMLRRSLSGGPGKAPSVGLTIIRDARVFMAPTSDFGFEDGFLALGSMSLPTVDGRRVGFLSAKGPPGRVPVFPPALRRLNQGWNAVVNAQSRPALF